MQSFAALNLPAPLLQAMDALGYDTPTPIQAAALPTMLAGGDVLAQAQTGSGKTVTFALAMLAHLDSTRVRLQGLVLCPTRELAEQVTRELRSAARFTPNVKILSLCGGRPIRTQIASLSHEPHIVVGTPGRIDDLLRKRALDVSAVHSLVLDEADRMLDMGFIDAIRTILGQLPKTRRSWLFSATYPAQIEEISSEFQHQPARVRVETEEQTGRIQQSFYRCEADQKSALLTRLLEHYRPAASLVFCNTQNDTDAVTRALSRQGISAKALHGGLDQRDRDETLLQFANQSCLTLVATDVAARGLHIQDLPLVISYELPNDPAVLTHRIGRTGRAGAQGRALTLVAPREEARAARIEELQGEALPWQSLPDADIGTDRAGRPMQPPMRPPMCTLMIEGGRQNKLRPGDILGALTGAGGLAGSEVGKIDIFPTRSYVAVRSQRGKPTVQKLRDARIKGRKFRVRVL